MKLFKMNTSSVGISLKTSAAGRFIHYETSAERWIMDRIYSFTQLVRS